MSYFRSKDMGLHYLIMPKESAYDIMNQIGSLNCIHLIDSDPNMPHYNRQYYNYMRRCDENLYKIYEIEFQINLLNLQIIQPLNYQALINKLQNFQNSLQRDEIIIFEEQEAFLEQKTNKMKQLVHSFQEIRQAQNKLILQRACLQHAQSLLASRGAQIQKQREQLQQSHIAFNFIIGTIREDDEHRFRRQLFRSTKANSQSFIKKIEKFNNEQFVSNELNSNQGQNKMQDDYQIMSTFVVVFLGESQGYLKQKIMRVINSFNANLFDLPENLNEIQPQIEKIEQSLYDTNLLLQMSKNQMNFFFDDLIEVKNDNNQNDGSSCSYIQELKYYFVKQRALFYSLTQLKLNKSIFVGLGWIQNQDVQKVQDALILLRKLKPYTAKGELQQIHDHKLLPPTHFDINEFTISFQTIVNTYGIPRYKEANPGLFTIITFPFLFGVMFGDIGHGTILFIISLYLFTIQGPNKGEGGEEDCKQQVQQNKIKGQENPLDQLYEARFLIILMAIFSIYCGLIYNEFFSIPINFFGSCYNPQTRQKIAQNCNYIFGMDPMWNSASNHLTYSNSLKMKMSIILGISHMTLGVLVKGSNAIHHRNPIDFFFEFLPQLLFLTASFGYLCFLIFLKWSIDYTSHTNTAPSLLSMMINFIIGLGTTKGVNIYGEPGYQELIQKNLLVLAVICVPLMLIPKPIINYIIYKRQFRKKHVQLVEKGGHHHLFIDEDVEEIEEKKQNGDLESQESKEDENPQHTRILHDAGMWLNPETKHFDLSQEFVHQGIETIEFVLGCVSNTASYLRLWALSLAHSQLSEVFFNKTILPSLEKGSAIGLVIGFNIFAQMTFGVLMCMDTMECFLHTLRLHWVEFQSKFYKGDGYMFKPFSFIKAMQDNNLLDSSL